MPKLAVNGIDLNVQIRGAGPSVVLLHGFPHTWQVWSEVIDDLAVDHRVVAPDLRGFGGSTHTASGMDAATVSLDIEQLIAALGSSPVTVVAIDAGVPPAFLLAMRRPEIVERLVLIESTLGRLPGAEAFFAGGPPWWFGFHAVPGLAEQVLQGNEAQYVGWFYDQGTRGRPVRPDVRAAIGAAFTEPGALSAALGYYRALADSSRQISDAAQARLTVPTVAVGAAPVGRALEGQLRPIADVLEGHLIEDCGHIVPLDRPAELLAIIRRTSQPTDPALTSTAAIADRQLPAGSNH